MQKIRSIFLLFLLALLPFCNSVFAQDNTGLRRKIGNKCKGFDGKVGIGILGLNFMDSLVYNDSLRFPMQSVYKVPLAIYILDRVDRDILRLDQKIRVVKSRLDHETWSPMLKDFSEDSLDISIRQLLLYSVSKSDNNACDLLFELAGGTKAVNLYFQERGVREMSIAATEAEMHANWDVQYSNWCRPSAMLQVLSGLYAGSWLRPESNQLLLKLMTESDNSPDRIKGKLPKDAIVAHKTGTGNVNAQGISSATNDVGIITLPNNKQYSLVIYLSDYKDNIQKGEKLIAEISKIVWDHYTR